MPLAPRICRYPRGEIARYPAGIVLLLPEAACTNSRGTALAELLSSAVPSVERPLTPTGHAARVGSCLAKERENRERGKAGKKKREDGMSTLAWACAGHARWFGERDGPPERSEGSLTAGTSEILCCAQNDRDVQNDQDNAGPPTCPRPRGRATHYPPTTTHYSNGQPRQSLRGGL